MPGAGGRSPGCALPPVSPFPCVRVGGRGVGGFVFLQAAFLLSSSGVSSVASDQEPAFPPRPELLPWLRCLHAGTLSGCGFFLLPTKAAVMGSDRQVMALGSRRGARPAPCSASRPLVPLALCHGAAAAELPCRLPEVAAASLSPMGLVHMRQHFTSL